MEVVQAVVPVDVSCSLADNSARVAEPSAAHRSENPGVDPRIASRRVLDGPGPEPMYPGSLLGPPLRLTLATPRESIGNHAWSDFRLHVCDGLQANKCSARAAGGATFRKSTASCCSAHTAGSSSGLRERPWVTVFRPWVSTEPYLSQCRPFKLRRRSGSWRTTPTRTHQHNP